MKQLHDGNISDFIHELQDLAHKYVGEHGHIMWSTENGWAEFELSMPRLEEDDE